MEYPEPRNLKEYIRHSNQNITPQLLNSSSDEVDRLFPMRLELYIVIYLVHGLLLDSNPNVQIATIGDASLGGSEPSVNPATRF